jgi:hypothetical protein
MAEETADREQASSQQRTTAGSPEHAQKSRSERAEILLRVFATPLTVAIIGYFTSSYLNRQQTADTNLRTFAELINRTENGGSDVRKEVFKAVLDGILKSETAAVDQNILRLEILAYNSDGSVDLSPIFHDILQRTSQTSAAGPAQARRLERVARAVVIKQMDALKTGAGSGTQASVDFEDLEGRASGLAAINEVLHVDLLGDPDARSRSARRFRVDVLSLDRLRRELLVRLVVSPPGDTTLESEPEVDTVFGVGFFDFPDTHNTGLSAGNRCAVVVTHLSEASAQISLIYFPGKEKMRSEELRQVLRLR